MLTLHNVEEQLMNMKNILLEKKGERRNLIEQKDKIKEHIKMIKEDLKVLVQSRQLLLDTVKFAREEAKYIIENLVTKSLQYVFEKKDIKFEINIRDLQNTTECDFLIVEDGEEYDPMESNGGGLIDVISFILRIALIQATNKISLEDDTDEHQIKNEAPLILDEPFKHLSEEHIPKVGKFLREISQQLNMQIILITHNKLLMNYGDKKFIVNKNDEGISEVKEVNSL